MQPRLGQLPGQGGPSALRVKWPSSAPRPWAAQLASLSTTTGSPKRRPSSARSGTPVSGMLTLVSTVPVAYSICEGTPTPMAVGCPTRPIRRRIASSSPSSRAAVLPRTVGRSIESRTDTPSTAATATLVPPTSTPRTTGATLSGGPRPGAPRASARGVPHFAADMSPQLVEPRPEAGDRAWPWPHRGQSVHEPPARPARRRSRPRRHQDPGRSPGRPPKRRRRGATPHPSGRRAAGRGGGAPGARTLPGGGGRSRRTAGLRELTGTRAYVENDVTVGVSAEHALGAARRSKSLLGVWWGTGVGGGIVLDGKPWEGRGAAAELGHVVVKIGGARCTCGRRGCLEAYAGRGSMEIRARHLHRRGHRTDLFKIMEKRGRTRLQSGVWARALEQNDPMATELIDRAVEALGAGVGSAVNLLDVETVVIGGGRGTRLGEPYVERIREAMMPDLFPDARPPAGAGPGPRAP